MVVVVEVQKEKRPCVPAGNWCSHHAESHLDASCPCLEPSPNRRGDWRGTWAVSFHGTRRRRGRERNGVLQLTAPARQLLDAPRKGLEARLGRDVVVLTCRAVIGVWGYPRAVVGTWCAGEEENGGLGMTGDARRIWGRGCERSLEGPVGSEGPARAGEAQGGPVGSKNKGQGQLLADVGGPPGCVLVGDVDGIAAENSM